MEIDILNRFTGQVQFTAEINADTDTPQSVKIGMAVKWAIKNEADLREADLREANLREADLRRADLRGTDLWEADLWEADLQEADLRGTDLWKANLPRNLIIIQTYPWTAYIQPGLITIGCERHKPWAWWNFTDQQIASMESRALDWWKTYKPMIRATWETF